MSTPDSRIFDLLQSAVADYQPQDTWAPTTPLTVETLRAAMDKIRDEPYRICPPNDYHVVHPQEYESAKTDPDAIARCANCFAVFPLGRHLQGRPA